jgi:hypothetical protein
VSYVNEQAVREMSDEELKRALEEDSMPSELFFALKEERRRRMEDHVSEHRCPVCGHNEWYIDYDPNENRVDRCEKCNWPPNSPMSVEEYRGRVGL